MSRPRGCRYTVVLALAACCANASATEAQAWSIPLVVQEALVDDPLQGGFQLLPGSTRKDEPVTVGLPLADALGITDIDQLGLVGSSVGQFRVLSRWPSGNLQWVLVDARADVPANGESTSLALVPGNGSFGGADLALETASTIEVDTGAARFVIRRQGFNLLDAVTVGGVALVPTGSPGIVLTAEDGTVYRAAADAGATVALEENGPARAVVVAKGAHRSAGGAKLLEFTVRMHFYKGKSRVRLFYTLRNAHAVLPAPALDPDAPTNARFQSLELVLRTSLAGSAFRAAAHAGDATGSLLAGERMRLFIGENAFPSYRDWDFSDTDGAGNEITTRWPTGIRGYSVTKGTQTLASGTREQYFDLAYARAATAAGAVTFGTRFATGLWPQGLGIDGDGTVRVSLFPPGNDRLYVARFAGHTTREVLLDFAAGTPASSASATMLQFQYPLVAKALDPGQYHRSGALWEPILALEDEVAAYRQRGWATQGLLDRRPAFQIYRHYYWGTGGGDNQYDSTKIDAHDFLRRSEPFAAGWYLNAEQRVSYNADLSVFHSDDFDAARDDTPLPQSLPNAERLALAKAIFEGEHRHAYGIPLLYYLSGDERLREAYADWGDWLHHFNAAGFNDYERGLMWNIYNLVDLYRFTGDPAHRDLAWQFFSDYVLPTAQPGVSGGTDWQRGFFASQWTTNNPDPVQGRVITSFVYAAIVPRAYAYLLEYGDLNALQRDRVRDVLEGVARFVAHELWYEYPDSSGNLSVTNFGLPYAQSVDVPRDPPDARLEPNWWGGFKEGWNAFYFGYVTTGDPEFLRQGTLLQRAAAANPEGWSFFQDWPDRQRLQRILDAPVPSGLEAVWTDLPLTVENLGGGTCRLSWTVPADAQEYWIKTADRAIVPWLGFDRVTRQFRYAPASFVPFFAADNLDGEPQPGAPGSTQVWASSARGGNCFFAARYLSRTRMRAIFADGFEGGTTNAWSATEPSGQVGSAEFP